MFQSTSVYFSLFSFQKDLHDVTKPEEKEVENQNNSQDQCSAGSSGKKRKVSIPSVPMKPSLVSSSAKGPGVKVAANKSIGNMHDFWKIYLSFNYANIHAISPMIYHF